MSFSFFKPSRPKTPQDVAKAIRDSLAALDTKTVVEVKSLEKALEEVEKNFATMRCMILGDGEVELNAEQVSQLAEEICKEDVISLLIHKLSNAVVVFDERRNVRVEEEIQVGGFACGSCRNVASSACRNSRCQCGCGGRRRSSRKLEEVERKFGVLTRAFEKGDMSFVSQFPIQPFNFQSNGHNYLTGSVSHFMCAGLKTNPTFIF